MYLFQDAKRCNDDEGNEGIEKLFGHIDEVVDCYTALNYSKTVFETDDTDMICEKPMNEIRIRFNKQTSQNLSEASRYNSNRKLKDECCCTCKKGIVI